ncbi:uncharacterized protein LOC126353957 isoform X2 [Schistocerca gregaria]|uniref:uncharacterized protein LOC126353957 isoform X2 n=1 Tax=Schistocerca gregaria TaxID=7010 RepID=UPI00211F34BC|nr:uncharacterized protein LOC126353957 isoform X2 [Schistocerca gregaria]
MRMNVKLSRCKTMAWRYIALGFRTDCFKLLSVFQASGCCTYKKFTEIWREMKFSYIYYERKSFCELLEFTEEVFMVCKEFLYPPNTLPFQIGSIYLMYGLYLKQPTRNQVKIRFTLHEWKHLKKVWNIALSANDLGVVLIISRLYLMNAFQFCFTERQMGLEKKFRKYYEGGEKSTGEMLPLTVTPVMEQLNIQALENTCKLFYRYEEARNNLNSVLLRYVGVEFKKQISTDVINNLKISALERIEKESKEINRYCELNDQTDSEDSNNEINQDTETGIPWWQCKKKMPWWKRCLPFSRKQTGKNKKHGRENSMEDSPELSLEEDIDDPDIIYFSEKNRKGIKREIATEAKAIVDGSSSVSSEDNMSAAITNILSPPGKNGTISKGNEQTIPKNIFTDKTSLPLEGNMGFSVTSYPLSPVNRRKGIERKIPTKAKTAVRDNSSVSSEDIMSVAITNIMSPPGKKRKGIKRKMSAKAKTVMTDNSSISSENNISEPISSILSPLGKKRKRSKGKRQTLPKSIISDMPLLTSEGNMSFGIPSCLSSPVNRREISKRKKSTNSMNIITHVPSAPSQGKLDVIIPNCATSAEKRREINARKKSTKRKNVTADISSVSSEGNKNVVVTPHTSSEEKRKTTGRKRHFAIRRYCQRNKSPIIRAVTTDVPSADEKYTAVSAHRISSVNERKLYKGKESVKTKEIVTDPMTYTSYVLSEGKENVDVPRQSLSLGNKRKNSTQKKSSKARIGNANNSSDEINNNDSGTYKKVMWT